VPGHGVDKDQFINWLDFADRMARMARPGLSGTTKARLVRSVGRSVRAAVARHGLEAFADWDGAPYPEDLFEDLLVDEGLLSRDARGGVRGETGLLALCCVKAGFDLAVSPSAGVVSEEFDVGLIRRMYPDGAPAFVTDHLDATGIDLSTAASGQRVWL